MSYQEILLYIFVSDERISELTRSGVDLYSENKMPIYRGFYEYLLFHEIYTELGESLN